MRTALTLGLLFVAAGACGHRTTGPVTEPHMAPATQPSTADAPAPPATDVAEPGMAGRMGEGAGRRMGPRAAQLPASLTDPDDPVLAEGKKIFDEVCTQCHTLAPPPKLAPPMAMVAAHLRDAFPEDRGGEEAAVAHILAYAPAPDAERSIMPPHAIQRFGLMAPQDLPPEQLEKVARYVWSLGGGMMP